jgi:hypothetical protein
MTLLNGFSTLLSGSVVLADKKPQFDPNSVTPGVIGFIATFVVIALVVLLVMDMVRRVRRTQYRAEVNERLDAEAAALLEQEGGSEDGSPDAPNAEPPAR